MNRIAEGELSKEDATKQTLAEVTPIFESLKRMEDRWLIQMGEALQEHQNLKQIEMMESNNRSHQRNNSNQHDEGTVSTIICFGCRKPGHTLPNCPDRNNRGNPSQNNQQLSQERNQAAQRTLFCYSCKEPGHSVADCPNKNNNKRKFEPQKVQGRKFACFYCGEEGHFAPDCPKKRSNFDNNNNTNATAPTCFSCKQEGHFANRCPNRGQQVAEQPTRQIRAERKRRTCTVCGVQGRHPRDSNCPGKKRKKNQSAESNQDDD